jgi:hypothetical protein
VEANRRREYIEIIRESLGCLNSDTLSANRQQKNITGR